MACAFGIAVWACGAVYLFQTGQSLRCAFYDDAFFYFQIARNVSLHRGFTFDGLHATNGFHPLWLFVLVPLYRLVDGDIEGARAVLGLELALIGASAALLVRLLRARIGLTSAALTVFLVFTGPGIPRMLRCGLESSLVLLLLVLCWGKWAQLRSTSPSAQGAALLGVLCGLLGLARLELFLLAPLLALALRSNRVCAAALLGPPACALASYVGWSWTRFGVLGPVSASIKAEEAADIGLAERLLHLTAPPWQGREYLWRTLKALQLTSWQHAAHGVLVLTLFLLFLRHRSAVLRAVASLHMAPFLGVAAAVILADTVVLGGASFWYAVPSLFAAAMFVGALVRRSPAVATAGCTVLAVVAVIQGALLAGRPGIPPCPPDSVFEWARTRTTATARIGSWNPGALAYFSHRHVVPLDGLVNDAEFRSLVRRTGEGLDAYLQRERIEWLLDLACDDSGPRARLEWVDRSSRCLEGSTTASFDLDPPVGCFRYEAVRLERTGPTCVEGPAPPP